MNLSRYFLAAAVVCLVILNAGDSSAQMNHDAHDGPAMNFHVIDDRLATGGHFIDDGLDRLAADGLEVVIDLRDDPPKDQADTLAAAGVRWVNIPVKWSDPKASDFDRFSAAMSEFSDRNVLVQCQANYRASAMTYLYRVKVDEIPAAEASEDLNAVWTPEGRWQEYIDSILVD